MEKAFGIIEFFSGGVTVFHVIPVNRTSTPLSRGHPRPGVQRRAFVLGSWWRWWCDVWGGRRRRLGLVRNSSCTWIRTTCARVMWKQEYVREGDGAAVRPERQGDGGQRQSGIGYEPGSGR